MTTGVGTKLAAVVLAAQDRLVVDLASSTGQPVIGYCRELVSWVVFGQHKPIGSPTERVRAAVRAAVNVGLKEIYGAENSPDIDSDITTRRDVL